jgi:hypothetical protein
MDLLIDCLLKKSLDPIVLFRRSPLPPHSCPGRALKHTYSETRITVRNASCKSTTLFSFPVFDKHKLKKAQAGRQNVAIFGFPGAAILTQIPTMYVYVDDNTGRTYCHVNYEPYTYCGDIWGGRVRDLWASKSNFPSPRVPTPPPLIWLKKIPAYHVGAEPCKLFQ